MSLILFLAKRFARSEHGARRMSRPVIRFSMASVALSVTVIIVSMAVLVGFKRGIVEKMVGFSAPVQIVSYDGNTSLETNPLLYSEILPLLPQTKLPGVKAYAPYATKGGILSSSSGIQGVVLKGVSAQYDFDYLKSCLVEGVLPRLDTPRPSNEVLISQTLARRMHLRTGDAFSLFFVQDPPRQRRCRIVGLYATQMKELDEMYVLGDLRHVQKLNAWTDDQVSGIEVRLTDMSYQPAVLQMLNAKVLYRMQSSGTHLKVEAIQEKHPQLFDWLSLQDTNAWVIMALMMLVSGFSMVTGLLIILLERTSTIGLLKALGMPDRKIQSVFVLQALRIASIGMLIGNGVGLGLCLGQKHFSWIRLNPESYYLDAVPIALDVPYLLLVNVVCFAVICFTLWIPSFYIAKIQPSTTLRFS